jgi:septin family protein
MWEQHETVDGPKYDGRLGYGDLAKPTTAWYSAEELAAHKTHKEKLKKMEEEMQRVFTVKVEEKVGNMKKSEEELYSAHREMKQSLERQGEDLEQKKVRLETMNVRDSLSASDGSGTVRTRDKFFKWMRD